MPYVSSTLGSYMTGTVTVVNGSTAVTGSGTLWSQIVCEGDILTLDDSKLYFVASVNSDTSLTLDKPYAESSGSGRTYRIILNTAAHFPSDVAAKVERALADLPAMCEDIENTYVPRSWTSSTGGAGKIPIATDEGFIPLNMIFPQHGNWKLKLSTGTFIQWFVRQNSINTDENGTYKVTFEEAFAVTPPAIALSTGYGNVFVSSRYLMTTGFIAYFYDQFGNLIVNSTKESLQVIAIGRWK